MTRGWKSLLQHVLTFVLFSYAQTYRELGVPGQQPPIPSTLSRGPMDGGLSNGLDAGPVPGSGSLGTGSKAEVDPLVLACHLVDFWTNICLCHSLIVEEAEDEGPPIYQACPAASVIHYRNMHWDVFPAVNAGRLACVGARDRANVEMTVH
jgi:hypothetical protein